MLFRSDLSVSSPGPINDRLTTWLLGAMLALLAVVGAGALAHRYGVLPPAFVPWARPLLRVALAASMLATWIAALPEILRLTRLAWTRRMLVACSGAVIVMGFLERAAPALFDRVLVGASVALGSLLGIALVVDGWMGMASGTLPRSGAWGAFLAGAGLVLLVNVPAYEIWGPSTAAVALAAICTGAILGRVARRQIRAAGRALDARAH